MHNRPCSWWEKRKRERETTKLFLSLSCHQASVALRIRMATHGTWIGFVSFRCFLFVCVCVRGYVCVEVCYLGLAPPSGALSLRGCCVPLLGGKVPRMRCMPQNSPQWGVRAALLQLRESRDPSEGDEAFASTRARTASNKDLRFTRRQAGMSPAPAACPKAPVASSRLLSRASRRGTT